jgi:hypothetical protein
MEGSTSLRNRCSSRLVMLVVKAYAAVVDVVYGAHRPWQRRVSPRYATLQLPQRLCPLQHCTLRGRRDRSLYLQQRSCSCILIICAVLQNITSECLNFSVWYFRYRQNVEEEEDRFCPSIKHVAAPSVLSKWLTKDTEKLTDCLPSLWAAGTAERANVLFLVHG